MQDLIQPNFLGAYRLKLNPRYPMEQRLLEQGVWEQHLVAYISHFVEPGFVCVDVGANVGFHTIAMAHYAGESGRVYAFEPNTLTFPRMVDNLNLNPALKRRVIVEKLGLAERNDTLRVYQSGYADGNAYVSAEFNPKLWNAGTEEDYELCIVTPLDEYLGGQAISFMKVDVEGMELEVFQGARLTIARNHPVIVYETLLQDFDPEKIRRCGELLQELGYHQFFLKPPTGKLIPCVFPNLAEDTLAIHHSQIVYYADIMLSAAQFTLTGLDNGTEVKLDLTIVGLGDGRFVFTTSHDLKSRPPQYQAQREGTRLKSIPPGDGAANNPPLDLDLDIFMTCPDNSFAAQPQCEGHLRQDGRSYSVTVVKQGGQLRDWTLAP